MVRSEQGLMTPQFPLSARQDTSLTLWSGSGSRQKYRVQSKKIWEENKEQKVGRRVLIKVLGVFFLQKLLTAKIIVGM